MDASITLIIISLLIILSYFASFLAVKIKLPSVLLLMALGVIFKLAALKFGFAIPHLSDIINILGTIGLVLIVLEASLDIEITQANISLIAKSFLSSFLIIIFTSAAYSALFYYFMNIDIYHCIIFSIPLSIISSAVIIPSAVNLTKEKKEFINLEAAFSDIVGVVLFDFVIDNKQIYIESFAVFLFKILLVLLFAVAATLFLIYIMQNNSSKIRYFLIFGFLLLFFGIGKYYHLSVLILILIFGLLLKNIEHLKYFKLSRILNFKILNEEIIHFDQINNEISFIIRTFFFFVFGMLLDFNGIINGKVLLFGTIILIIQYIVRMFYLMPFVKSGLITHILASPRGLVTILLYFSIEKKDMFHDYTNIMFLVIAMSIIIMSFTIIFNKNID